MNKEQFLKELEDLLQDIDATEREEALNYYRDYFEDAGSEHEQEIINTLEDSIYNVTSEELALTIKFLSKSCTADIANEDYTVITPQDKINKNTNKNIIYSNNVQAIYKAI